LAAGVTVLTLTACTPTPPEHRTPETATAAATAGPATQTVTGTGDLAREILGAWKFTIDQTDVIGIEIFSADGTVRGIDNPTTLMNPATFTSDPYRIDHNTLIITAADNGNTCTKTTTIHRLADGLLTFDPQTLTGTCPYPAWPTQRLTRLSPASAAGQALRAAADSPGVPVTDSISLEGIWLLAGTGQLLAYAEKSGSHYQLDSEGHLGTTPADHGTLTVKDSGAVILTSYTSSCRQDTSWANATVHGIAPQVVLHATVTNDPCHHFYAHTDITMIQIL
jgi:hypothetical protein